MSLGRGEKSVRVIDHRKKLVDLSNTLGWGAVSSTQAAARAWVGLIIRQRECQVHRVVLYCALCTPLLQGGE